MRHRNSCIAEAIRRFPIDLYHINDCHGAVAPLHLLPRVIPCCLSLHNVELQGSWRIRTPRETDELCRIYNLELEVVRKYVQFGEVFNLLHAGASYIRVWQNGFGVVGVSKKHSIRSFARHPIFWGLGKIGSLPYADPTDTEGFIPHTQFYTTRVATVDQAFEARRPALKSQVQEWANLEPDPDAEIFVFSGQWSMQRGIDLIADVFPAILEKHSTVQLICVGPVVDLYGKFAALKLERLASLYPHRVYSKPELWIMPPYIFTGAEFALVPSREDPFGLMAVEFGRKGALGVGARIGGLGNMPGWWFTVESTTSKHMISQFKMAVEAALASSAETRAIMRTQAVRQRFPVAQWSANLDLLHDTAIMLSRRKASFKGSEAARVSGTGIFSTQIAMPPKLFYVGGRAKGSISPRPGTLLSETYTVATSTSGLPRTGPSPFSFGRKTLPGHTDPAGSKYDRLGEACRARMSGTSPRYEPHCLSSPLRYQKF